MRQKFDQFVLFVYSRLLTARSFRAAGTLVLGQGIIVLGFKATLLTIQPLMRVLPSNVTLDGIGRPLFEPTQGAQAEPLTALPPISDPRCFLLGLRNVLLFVLLALVIR